jgi:hypothetical protein
MKRISKFQLNYIAGFFDGEGCIFIKAIKNKCIPPLKTIGVTITNNNPAVLKFIQKKFGGNIILKRNSAWQLYSHPKIEYFLRAVIPYLKIKKEQAEVALKFINLKKAMKKEPVYRRNNNSVVTYNWGRSMKYIYEENILSERIRSFNSNKGRRIHPTSSQ